MVWPVHSVRAQELIAGVTPAPVRMIRLAAALNVRLFFDYFECSDGFGSVLLAEDGLPAHTLAVNLARPTWEKDAYRDLRGAWECYLELQMGFTAFEQRHSGQIATVANIDRYLGGLFAGPN